MPGDADARQQAMHGELRVARDRRRAVRFRAADEIPGGIVERGVEARQHHRAAGMAGDDREQARGGRHRAGRARGDDGRVGRRDETARFGGDQAVAPLRRLDGAALGEDRRPCLAGDAQEPQGELPILVEMVGHQGVEALPRHLAGDHVVHQPRQIVGERERRRRMPNDQRRLARARLQPLGPGVDEARQQKTPLQPAQRRRQVEGIAGGGPGRHVGEDQFVLVDVADRHDARQHRGVDPRHVEKGIAGEPAGPPRRQEDGGARQGERVGCRQAFDQAAVPKRADQCRQERHRRRNGEHARVHGQGHGDLMANAE